MCFRDKIIMMRYIPHGCNPSRSSSETTPLNSLNNGLIFLGVLTDGATSSFTTKANSYFVSFDFTKNLSRLHLYMNFGSFSFVNFGVGGIDLMATILLFQVNILYSLYICSVHQYRVVMVSPKEYDNCSCQSHHK